MTHTRSSVILTVAFVVCVINVTAQTSMSFDLNSKVIAGGGGKSDSANFVMDVTIAEIETGARSTSGSFDLKSGFWGFQLMPPTSALSNVSGRVTTFSGAGVVNVRIRVMDLNSAVIRSAVTNSFGYFVISDIPAGYSYIFSAHHRSLVFLDNPRFITVNEDLVGIDFLTPEN